MDIDELPYVPARLRRDRPAGTRIDWVVIHDMEAPEGPLTAENVARYFQSLAAKGSAHINADNNSCVRSVKDEQQAAHAPGSNTQGLGLELAGYARQTLAQWMDEYSVATMENGADCTAQWMHKHNIPNQYVDAAGLRAGRRGWTTHWQVTLAFGRSTHTDPGPNFPIAYFQARINHYYYGNDEGDLDLTMGQYEDLKGQMIGANTMLAHMMKQQNVMFDYLIGDTQEERHNAIVTRIQYLFGEAIGDQQNLEQFRALLDNAIKDSKNIEELKEMLSQAIVPVPAAGGDDA